MHGFSNVWQHLHVSSSSTSALQALSDRDAGLPTLEERMDDVRAVMDAVGSERAAILGHVRGRQHVRPLCRDLSRADSSACYFLASFANGYGLLTTLGRQSRPFASEWFRLRLSDWGGVIDLVHTGTKPRPTSGIRRLVGHISTSRSKPERSPRTRPYQHPDRYPRNFARYSRSDAGLASTRRP